MTFLIIQKLGGEFEGTAEFIKEDKSLVLNILDKDRFVKNAAAMTKDAVAITKAITKDVLVPIIEEIGPYAKAFCAAMFAVIFSPIAVIMAKKKFNVVIVNILLFCCYMIPGIIHAVLIVKRSNLFDGLDLKGLALKGYRKDLDLKGYRKGLDLKGLPNNITATYNLPQDISDNGYTYQYITTETPSIMKNMVKLGMGVAAAEMGAASVSSRGTRGLATGAALSGAVALKMSGTSTKHRVIVTFQFNDKSIFTGEFSKGEFSELDDELNILDFERYEVTMKGVLQSYNEQIDDIRSKFSTMNTAKRTEKSEALASFMKVVPRLEKKIEYYREQAKERGIGAFSEITAPAEATRGELQER